MLIVELHQQFIERIANFDLMILINKSLKELWILFFELLRLTKWRL